jgi:hypothetical protein
MAMTDTAESSGRQGPLLGALAFVGPLFFCAVAGLHAGTGWNLEWAAVIGAGVLLVVSVLLLLLGLVRLRRFPAHAGMAILLPTLFCAVLMGGKSYWQGAAFAEVTFVVTDAQTGQPVPNAVVRISFMNDDPGASEGRTDAAGSVRLFHEFHTDGVDSPFHDSAGMTFVWRRLQVTAEGYCPVQELLSEYGHGGYPLARPIPPVRVPVYRK